MLVVGGVEVAYRLVTAETAVTMCIVQREEESPCLNFHLIRMQGEELQVWEKCGGELLGMLGLEFARTLPQWWQKKELFQSMQIGD